MPSLRRVLALVVLSLLAFGARAQGAPYVLSERVGPALDARERAYFGLFPDYAEGFDRATFWNRGDSLVVQIHYAPGGVPQVADVVLSHENGTALGRFVETFEGYADPVRNPNWSPRLPTDPHVPVPYVGRDRRISARLPEGVYTGQLLYATDSLLLLAPSVQPWDPALPGAYALGTDEVEAVTLEDHWRRWSRELLPVGAAGLGAAVVGVFALNANGEHPADETLVSAAIGAGFGYAVASVFGQLREKTGTPGAMGPTLQAWAHYSEVQPPEFPREDLAALRSRPRPAARAPRHRRRHEWVSVGIQSGQERGLGGYGLGLDSRDIVSGDLIEGRTGGLRPPVGARYRFDLAVRPLTWVRAGVLLEAGTRPEVPAPALTEELAVVEPGRTQGYLEAVLPLVRFARARLEVAAGIGRERYREQVGLTLPPRYTVGPVSAVLLEPLSYTYEAEGARYFPRVTVELFASERSSFYLQWAWHRYPSVEVAEFGAFYYNDPSVQAYRVDAHTVDFSYSEALFGTRFHF